MARAHIARTACKQVQQKRLTGRRDLLHENPEHTDGAGQKAIPEEAVADGCAGSSRRTSPAVLDVEDDWWSSDDVDYDGDDDDDDNCHPSNNSPLRETDQFKDWNLSANLWHFSSCSVCNWSRV